MVTKTATRFQLTTPTIGDVNKLLEKLLLKELPLKKNGVEISFDLPKREWSARLNGPTLNVFLYDVRKNKLRQAQWETTPNGTNKVTQQRPALKIDLHYMITAWVIDGNPDEEHYLLTAALLALARHPRLPDGSTRGILPADSVIDLDFLPETLRSQPGPIPLTVAEPEDLVNPSDVWSAVDNDLRPSIACTISLALDPFQPIEIPMPVGREVRVSRLPDSQLPASSAASPRQRAGYAATGTISAGEPIEGFRLLLAGRGRDGQDINLPIAANDTFTHYEFNLPQLQRGDYTLIAVAKNRSPVACTLSLPAPAGRQTYTQGGLTFTIDLEEK